MRVDVKLGTRSLEIQNVMEGQMRQGSGCDEGSIGPYPGLRAGDYSRQQWQRVYSRGAHVKARCE